MSLFLNLQGLHSFFFHLFIGCLILTLSLPACLSTSAFSLQYQYKISWLAVKIKELIIHSKLFKMKCKILLTHLSKMYEDR